METIEQLKQENNKLNGRLAKAVEVFKEQKANIDNLTSQVESLQKELETYKNAPVADVSEYENKITLLEEDNIKLSEQNHSLEEKIQQSLEVSKSYNDQLLIIDKLTKQNEDLQKQLNEYELKLQDSETAYEQLYKKYEERKKQVAELMGSQAANVETIKNEYELKLQNSKNTYEELQKKYNEVSTENKQLKEHIASMVTEATNMAEEYAKVTLSLENYKNENTTLKNDIKTLNEDVIKQNQEIEKLKIEKSDLEVNINDLTNRLSESVNGKTKYQEFTEMIVGLVESFTNNGNNIDTDKHSSITVNTYKNSTGSQFMTDAPGMNI